MNPILPLEYFIPDVEANVDADGKMYLYGSNDLVGDNTYCSHEYHVFSSQDLLHWDCHLQSFHRQNSHVSDPSAPLFAPDCAYIRDRYCLFYCQMGGVEGVAFSDTPDGPFGNAKAIDIADRDMIDPTVLVDEDGAVYYFWGQFALRGGKMDPDTLQLLPETVDWSLLTKEQDGFHEGASAFKRNGKYYMLFADESRGRPTALGYAISDYPLGPYVKKGIVIDNTGCDPSSWNNHGSVVCFNDQWYVLYHRSTHNSVYSRRACMEPITFDEQGLIAEVEMTTQGVEPPIDCQTSLNVSRACLLSGGCYFRQYRDQNNCYDYLDMVTNGCTLAFKYLHFTDQVMTVEIEASCVSYDCAVEVILDTPENPPIATVPIQRTAGNFDFAQFSAPFDQVIDGDHAVYLRFVGDYEGVLCYPRAMQFC